MKLELLILYLLSKVIYLTSILKLRNMFFFSKKAYIFKIKKTFYIIIIIQFRHFDKKNTFILPF